MTRLTPSSSAATTVAQRSFGTPRTTAKRESSTPHSCAESPPRVPGRSTAAAHSPAAVAAAARPSANEVTPAPGSPPTVATVPRCSAPPGRSAPSGPGTGEHPVAGQHHGRAALGDLLEMGARLRVTPRKRQGSAGGSAAMATPPPYRTYVR